MVLYSYHIPDDIVITNEKKSLFSATISGDNVILQTLIDITVSGQTISLQFSGDLTLEALLYLDTIKDHCILSDTDSIHITTPSHNKHASGEPTAQDDISRNYDTTSEWGYNGLTWVCSDNTLGNAVWNRVLYENDPLMVMKDNVIQYTFPELIGGENHVLAIEDGSLLFKHAKYATNKIVYTDADYLDVRIDPTGSTILMSDGGSYAVNTIRAITNEIGMIDIITHSASHVLYQDIRVGNITIKLSPVSQQPPLAANELNSLFTQTASISGSSPTITSSLAVTITENETLNYELMASFSVGYEWNTLPPGIVVSTTNRRKLIGGSSLPPGDHTIIVKAINYYGYDEKTIILTVSPLPYSNTRSIRFDNHEYMESEVGSLNPIFGRTGSGDGADDSWSVSIFFKPGDSHHPKQTIFYYGTSDKHDEHLRIQYVGSWVHKNIMIQYGSHHNYLMFVTDSDIITDPFKWYHLFLTYDGGETGSSSDQVSSYYSSFKFYIDGVLQTTTNTHENYGISSSFGGDTVLRIGKDYKSDYMRDNCKIDEVAIWDSDRSSDIADIYNGGVTHTLSLLPSPPLHWWRMGDGDTYPSVQDNISDTQLTMYNMTIDNVTTDAP